MKRNYKKLLTAAALGAFAFAAVPDAQAVATIQIFVDNVLTFTAYDNNAAGLFGAATATDLNSGVAGGMILSVTTGGWTVVTTTASTYPLNGTQAAAEMALSVNATSNLGATSTLRVQFSELAFGPITNGAFRVSTSGTIDIGTGAFNPGPPITAESVSGQALFSNTNTQMAGTALGSVQTITSDGVNAAFGLNQTSGLNSANPYALTEIINITHFAGSGRNSSVAMSLIQQAPDGGTTLSLLGCSLLGLAGIRRKLASA